MTRTNLSPNARTRALTLTLLAVAVLLAIATPAHARYQDGMNMYQYVQSRPTVATDPEGLITWVVHEDALCTITAIVSVKINWIGTWTPQRKDHFQEEMRNQIENTFNAGTYSIKPNNTEYKDWLGQKKTCPCPNGFDPRVGIVFLDSGEWKVNVTANPTVTYRFLQSSTNVLDEADITSLDKKGTTTPNVVQIPVVHEFGHFMDLEHPGEGVKGVDEFLNNTTDRHGRKVDGMVDLMGVGMGLRKFYYEKWETELNSHYTHWFCGCDYETQ